MKTCKIRSKLQEKTFCGRSFPSANNYKKIRLHEVDFIRRVFVRFKIIEKVDASFSLSHQTLLASIFVTKDLIL